MKFEVDLHTHTIASGHAYSKLQENINYALNNEIKLLGVTEHTNGMVGGAQDIYFANYRAIPRNFGSLELLMGAEVNIMDFDGTLDVNEDLLKEMDIVIASMHPLCIPFGNIEQNTNAIIKAMENKYINIIGHPGDPRYPIDVKEIVQTAIKTNTLIEINNASLNPGGFRVGSKDYIVNILNLCKSMDFPVILGSDAHFSTAIGVFNFIEPVLEEVKFPKELIINSSVNNFKSFISQNNI